jgi:very-short-patch-repair endonuclease
METMTIKQFKKQKKIKKQLKEAKQKILINKFIDNSLPAPVLEYRFYPDRKWKIDIAYPGLKIGIEIEGGLWIYGRHNRPASMIKDMEKYNKMAEMGWYLLRYQPNKIDFQQIHRTIDNNLNF